MKTLRLIVVWQWYSISAGIEGSGAELHGQHYFVCVCVGAVFITCVIVRHVYVNYLSSKHRQAGDGNVHSCRQAAAYSEIENKGKWLWGLTSSWTMVLWYKCITLFNTHGYENTLYLWPQPTSQIAFHQHQNQAKTQLTEGTRGKVTVDAQYCWWGFHTASCQKTPTIPLKLQLVSWRKWKLSPQLGRKFQDKTPSGGFLNFCPEPPTHADTPTHMKTCADTHTQSTHNAPTEHIPYKNLLCTWH